MQRTRERILKIIQSRRKETVADLARALELAQATVRRHLDILQRDRVVTYREVRKKTGRPEYSYFLTEEGQESMPKGYDRLLSMMIEELGSLASEDTSSRDGGQILEMVFRRLADRVYDSYEDQLAGRGMDEHLATLMDRMDPFSRLVAQYLVTYNVERDLATVTDMARQLLEPQSSTGQAAPATLPASLLYNALILQLLDLGEFEHAEEVFPPYLAAVEELQPEYTAASWVNMAMVAAARHDTSTALDRLDRSGLLDPENVVVNTGWYWLHVLVEVGEYARAADQARLARSQTSLDWQRHHIGFLGTIEALRGRPVASRTAFTQAVTVAQEHEQPAVELAMRLQHAQAEFFVLDEPARAAAALAPVLGTTEPLVGTVRRFVAKGEALREAICDALPTAMTELPGGNLQCGAPSQVDSALTWIETIERMGWEHLAAGRLQQATAPVASPRLPRAGGDGIRALLPAAVAYERLGMPDSAAAIYEEIVRLSPIGNAREFAGYSLAYEQYALRRLVAMGGAAADDARRQLQHAWQDAEPEFRRRVVEVVLGR
ncbi:MAG: ArsR family transcriptional regulator [Gemmatimonadetes bacterium]|nr:ArsR family transcriptional regulator [Gemmatimonadota bacterium]